MQLTIHGGAKKLRPLVTASQKGITVFLSVTFPNGGRFTKILAFTRTNKDPRTLLTYSTAENEAVT